MCPGDLLLESQESTPIPSGHQKNLRVRTFEAHRGVHEEQGMYQGFTEDDIVSRDKRKKIVKRLRIYFSVIALISVLSTDPMHRHTKNVKRFRMLVSLP